MSKAREDEAGADSTPPSASHPNRRKRKAWSLEQKLFIIQLKDEKPGISLDGLCKCFRESFQEEIARQTLSDWLQPKNVQKLKEHAHHAVGRTKQSQKRCRKLRLSAEKGGPGSERCISLKLETVLYLWYKQQLAKISAADNTREPVLSKEDVLEKAREMALHPSLKRTVPDGYHTHIILLFQLRRVYVCCVHMHVYVHAYTRVRSMSMSMYIVVHLLCIRCRGWPCIRSIFR